MSAHLHSWVSICRIWSWDAHPNSTRHAKEHAFLCAAFPKSIHKSFFAHSSFMATQRQLAKPVPQPSQSRNTRARNDLVQGAQKLHAVVLARELYSRVAVFPGAADVALSAACRALARCPWKDFAENQAPRELNRGQVLPCCTKQNQGRVGTRACHGHYHSNPSLLN